MILFFIYVELIRGFADKVIADIACGNNHSLAIDDKGRVYSWGFGGYGRYGCLISFLFSGYSF